MRLRERRCAGICDEYMGASARRIVASAGIPRLRTTHSASAPAPAVLITERPELTTPVDSAGSQSLAAALDTSEQYYLSASGDIFNNPRALLIRSFLILVSATILGGAPTADLIALPSLKPLGGRPDLPSLTAGQTNKSGYRSEHRIQRRQLDPGKPVSPTAAGKAMDKPRTEAVRPN